MGLALLFHRLSPLKKALLFAIFGSQRLSLRSFRSCSLGSRLSRDGTVTARRLGDQMAPVDAAKALPDCTV